MRLKHSCGLLINFTKSIIICITLLRINPTDSLPPYHDIESSDDLKFPSRGLPGDTHEFRLNVEAGKQECLYQTLREGANMHLAFEVSSLITSRHVSTASAAMFMNGTGGVLYRRSGCSG